MATKLFVWVDLVRQFGRPMFAENILYGEFVLEGRLIEWRHASVDACAAPQRVARDMQSPWPTYIAGKRSSIAL